MIGQAAHADAHVQPSVTIDQVVAALAHDDVAALAAKDNIAGAKLADVRDAGSIQVKRSPRRQNGRPATQRRKIKLEELIQEVLQPIDQPRVQQQASRGRYTGRRMVVKSASSP